MKLAIATLYDAHDPLRGSGSYFHLCRQLEDMGHPIAYLGPISWTQPRMSRLFKKISTKMGMRYRSYQDVFSARVIGNDVTRKLSTIDYDVLITNDYGIAGYVKSEKPIIIYTDAIFPRNYASNQHPWLDNLSPFSVKFCQRVTRKGLRKSSLCCFASDWAVQEAGQYHIKAIDELKVIPYGANIDEPSPEIAENRNIGDALSQDRLRLLFVGKDWTLKGGDVAIRTVNVLRERGINVEIHMVGSNASFQSDRDYVIGYGFMSKDNPEDRERLHMLFKNSDIFLLPSAAEGFGIVYAEAAAYGLPSLGYRTTGVKTSVKNNVSGVLIEKNQENPAAAFADVIQYWCEHPQKYDQIARSSREYYECRVNWSVASQTLLEEISSL